jgi:hypothetical protein
MRAILAMSNELCTSAGKIAIAMRANLRATLSPSLRRAGGPSPRSPLQCLYGPQIKSAGPVPGGRRVRRMLDRDEHDAALIVLSAARRALAVAPRRPPQPCAQAPPGRRRQERRQQGLQAGRARSHQLHQASVSSVSSKGPVSLFHGPLLGVFLY